MSETGTFSSKKYSQSVTNSPRVASSVVKKLPPSTKERVRTLSCNQPKNTISPVIRRKKSKLVGSTLAAKPRFSASALTSPSITSSHLHDRLDTKNESLTLPDPNPVFMRFLNTSASKIQKWYRTQRCEEKSRESAKIYNNNDHQKSSNSDEDQVRLRRQRLAEQARIDILHELMVEEQQKQSESPLIAASAEPIIQNVTSESTAIVEKDVICEADNSTNPTCLYDYEYDFEPLDTFNNLPAPESLLNDVPENKIVAEHMSVSATNESLPHGTSEDTTETDETRLTIDPETLISVSTEETDKPLDVLYNNCSSDVFDQGESETATPMSSFKPEIQPSPVMKEHASYRLEIGKIPRPPRHYQPTQIISFQPPEPSFASTSSLGLTSNYHLQSSRMSCSGLEDGVDRATNDTAATESVDRILNFLKTVEEETREATRIPHSTKQNPVAMMAELLKETNQSQLKNPSPETTTAVFDGVKAKIMGQQVEIEEKSRTLDLLKKELKKVKELNKEQSLQQ